MWIGDSGGNVELEVLVIFNIGTTKLDNALLANLDDRLVEYIVKYRIHFLFNILEQDLFALNNTHFNLLYVVLVLEICNDQGITFHLLNPIVGLALRINVECPSETTCD